MSEQETYGYMAHAVVFKNPDEDVYFVDAVFSSKYDAKLYMASARHEDPEAWSIRRLRDGDIHWVGILGALRVVAEDA